MLNKDLLAINYLYSTLKLVAPYDTGNLALNSIRIARDQRGYKVLIGGEIAPYAPITNAKWEKGQNPNEGWVQRAIHQALPKIKQIYAGDITREEVEKYERYVVQTLKDRLIQRKR